MDLEASSNSHRVSAADIVVPHTIHPALDEMPVAGSATFPTEAGIKESMERLRALKAGFGPKDNQHDLAMVLITACIEEGLNTRKLIVTALAKLGMNKRHAAIILNESTGFLGGDLWRVDKLGIYTLNVDI